MQFYKGASHVPELVRLTEMKEEKLTEKFTFSSLKQRAIRQPLIISVLLVILNQFTGCYIILGYTTKVFKDAGSSLTPIESSILIVIVQIVANIFTIYLIDRVGRKILFVSSSIGTGIALASLVFYQIYQDQLNDYRWFPIFALSFVIFVASLGLLSIPFTIIMDILPPNVSKFNGILV